MPRFVFVTSPFMGHINPALSVGAELLQRGHEVIWLSLLRLPEEVIPRGGKIFLIQEEQPNFNPVIEEKEYDESPKKPFGLESLVNLYDNVLMPLNRYMYERIASLVDRILPDIIITDHQAFAGAVCAYNKKIPFATFATAPAAVLQSKNFPKIIEWEAQQIILFQKENGIELEKSIACSEMLTIVFSSSKFIGQIDFPENYQFVGPALDHRLSINSFAWDKLKVPFPKILVSIGSILKGEAEFFSKIIDAFSNAPLTVVVVANPQLVSRWPENFIVQEYVPQLELLPYMSAVICHGGHNTVCESLFYGVPVITVPMVNDQSFVATLVANAGCGIRLKFKRLTSALLRDSITEVLTNEQYKKAATDISNSFKEAGGTVKTANLLENLYKQNLRAEQKMVFQ